jgi:hypothetical protein
MKQVLAALAFVLAPMGMAAAQPAAAQTDASERAFAEWVVRVTGVIERASAANDVFTQFYQSYDPNGGRAEQLAAMRAVRDLAGRSRPQLAALGGELNTIGPFQHPDAPAEYAEFSRSMIDDTQIYLRNMDDVLGVMIEAVDAFERDDRAAWNRIGPRLIRSASLLIDGQIVMFRGRQRTIPASESAHHSLGTMVALYEGMSALVMPDVRDRPAALNAAADSAATWGASGRAALTQQRAREMGYAPREQTLVDQMMALEQQFYAANDTAVSLLRAAAQDAASGASGQQLNMRYTPRIAAIESEFQRLNQQQVALYAQLAQ